MRSITDNITEDKLLGEMNEISGLPMYADRKAHADRKAQQQKQQRRRWRRVKILDNSGLCILEQQERPSV